jgi:hypothetical protein
MVFSTYGVIIGWQKPDLTKSYLKQEPWVNLCEWCHKNVATDGHHMLIHRMAGVKQLDLPENICWLCHDCHMNDGRVNSYEMRVDFWETQCNRLGKNIMEKWLADLPIKSKPKYGG